MADARSRSVELRYTDVSGRDVTTTLAEAEGAKVVRGQPVRTFPTYQGQQNYPGLLWSATTSALIGYESLLERDRLWLADFDPQVRWIAGQPFWMSGRDGSRLRRHVPDFLLETDGGFLVVDVKPAAMLDHPKVAEQLAWCGQLCADRGWSYEVWSGEDPVVLRNIRFLAAGRRGWATDPHLLREVEQHAAPGRTLAQVADLAGEGQQDAWPASHARAALLALLWAGKCKVDLAKPLGPESVLLGQAS